jgi:hypothetical protein
MSDESRTVVAVGVGVAILAAAPAWAYIDMGTGSMLIQSLAAGLLGLAVMVRVFWTRIVNVFRRGAKRDVEERPGA